MTAVSAVPWRVVVRTEQDADGRWWRIWDDDAREQFDPDPEPAANGVPAEHPHTAPVNVDEVYPVIDWPTLWSKAGAPVEWLCEPLLIAGRVVALFSPAKAGKSLLSLEVGAALATGRAVLGNPGRPPLRVLYVDLENTEDDLRERLTDLGYGPDNDLANLRYLSFPALPSLDSEKGGKHLRAIAEHHDAQLVIIDTVSRVIDGDEDSADTFRALYRHAIMPLKAAGRAVLRLDHGGKDLTRGQRGSSAKVDDVDSVWRLTARPGGAIDLTRTHSRHNHGADVLRLVRLTKPLRHELGQVGAVIAADVQEVIDQLDRLDVPLEWGRDKAKTALLEGGIRRGNDLLTEALRARKNRPSDLSRTGPEPDDPQIPLDDDTGQVDEGW